MKLSNKAEIDSFGITATELRDDTFTHITLDGVKVPCVKIGGSERIIHERRKSFTVNDYDVQCSAPNNMGEFLWFTFTTDETDSKIISVAF